MTAARGSRALEAARELLALVDGGNGAGRRDALRRALDRLSGAVLDLAPGTPESDLEPPRGDATLERALVSRRFPELGLYREAALDPQAELTVGDAVDDLVDVALDLRDVLWLHEHAGERAALAHLRFSFDVHWGEHLRALQWVLHAIATGGEPGGRAGMLS